MLVFPLGDCFRSFGFVSHLQRQNGKVHMMMEGSLVFNAMIFVHLCFLPFVEVREWDSKGMMFLCFKILMRYAMIFTIT